MKLIYVPEQAARDRMFVRNLVSRYKYIQARTLLIHHTGVSSPEANMAATKRFSALLGEEMVVNLPLFGHLREIFRHENGHWRIRKALLEAFWETTNCLVASTLASNEKGDPFVAEPSSILPAINGALNPAEIILFPERPASALASQRRKLTAHELENLGTQHPEAAHWLCLAKLLAPVTAASSTNFA